MSARMPFLLQLIYSKLHEKSIPLQGIFIYDFYGTASKEDSTAGCAMPAGRRALMELEHDLIRDIQKIGKVIFYDEIFATG